MVARGVIPLGGNIELAYDTFANIINGAGQVAAVSGNFNLDANGNPTEDFIYTSYEDFEPGVWNITFLDPTAHSMGIHTYGHPVAIPRPGFKRMVCLTMAG